MELEDAQSSQLLFLKLLGERDDRIAKLETIKAQKGELEQTLLKVRVELGQREEEIAFQKAQLADADRGARELEAGMLRLRREHNKEVNAIEQKLQRERIDAQILKNQ